jgi:hypothetical protein
LVLGFEATAEGVRSDNIIDEVLSSTAEPRAEIRGTP